MGVSIRVLVADDNALFREGLASLLVRCDGVQVVGQAADAAAAVDQACLLRADVVLMDLAMPLGGGVEATRRVLARRPETAICMLTVSEQATDLFAAIRAGARGYLVKTASIEELCTGLQMLADGGSVVTPHLAARLLDEFIVLADAMPAASNQTHTLTPRERQVLQLVARGSANREIAGALVIAENTVKVHLRNMLDKLQLRNRRQAAAFAVQEGLVTNVREPVLSPGQPASSWEGVVAPGWRPS